MSVGSRAAKRAVAVTGIGMICPVGLTTADCWESLLAGRSGIRGITRFDPSDCATRIAGELPDAYFQLEKETLPSRFFKRSILPTRLAFLVARQAVEDARLDVTQIDRRRAAVITGCGGSTFGDQLHVSEKTGKIIPYSYDMLNMLGACVSVELGFKGPCFNVATACSSGAFAVQIAADRVRSSMDVCVAIGAETVIHKEVINAFSRMMALSERNDEPERASRPFDKTRTGFVIAEGAAALVLESLEHATRRGARIYALLTGAASTSEAHNIVAPEPEGSEMARTMELAIRNAGLAKEAIGYISAHATSTIHNDAAETKAIKRVFGPRAHQIPVSAQKSMTGHTIGAAGAIEAAVTALTIYHRTATPTINYEIPDPECDLDYVPNQPRKLGSLQAALSNSFAFGGHNATLVFERVENG
jgi:3-oxoacyl-[acyl-carrier-protein] synthase II